MKRIALLLLILPLLAGAGVLFEDDFSDGNADSWLEWTSGYGANASYSVVDGEYLLHNSGSGWIPAASHNGDQSGVMSVADYSILARITPQNCYRAGILARGYVPGFMGYLIVIIPSENKFGISRLTSSGPVTITSMNVPLYFNQTYWVRFQVEGTQLSGKVWQGSANDEPAEWMLTCSNSQYANPGRIGVFCCNFGTDTRALLNVKFDDMVVSTIESSALSPLSWAGIKAASL